MYLSGKGLAYDSDNEWDGVLVVPTYYYSPVVKYLFARSSVILLIILILNALIQHVPPPESCMLVS